MKKRRIIKLTEDQLRETEGEAFKYLDTTDDSHPYNGQSSIFANGKIDGDEDAEPVTADRITRQRTPQGWARYRTYGSFNKKPIANELAEGVQIKSEQGDEDGDGIDDTYTNVASMGQGNGVETMSDNDSSNNLAVIPDGVDRRLDGLINIMKQHNLNPKQIATVLDKFQESFPELGQNSEWVKSLLCQQIDPKSIKHFH